MKSLQRIIAVFFLVFFSHAVYAQVHDSIKAYVREALDTIRHQSLFSKKVNWQTARNKAELQLTKAKTMLDAEAIVIEVFKQLEDNHGMYAGVDTSYKYMVPGPERIMSKSILQQYQKQRSVKIKMLENGIAYFKMPAVLIGSDQKKMKEWANLMMDSLCRINALKPKAYIIDLRMNNGGNSEPMWQIIKNFVGEANKTYLADADLHIIPVKPDSAELAYQRAAVPDSFCVLAKNILTVPVAVLTGPGTASSGEIMALSLSTRLNTRSFGEPSIGVATATNGFIIQNKGYLLLTVNYIANARKKVLTDKFINPDVFVKSDTDDYENPEHDGTVLVAMKWLKGKLNAKK
ncbi:MAG: S41 family peptidase [Ferruginibacter sp.]